MTAAIEFDEELSKKVERVYLTPDVLAQRCQTLTAMNLRPGERVLDIGSGPGLLARDIALAVGQTGSVVGIDTSTPMISMGQSRCSDLAWAQFQQGDAMTLPFEDASFDAVVSTQVYEYVADIPAAFLELARVLRPGGRAVLVDTDYDSWVVHTSDAERFARIRQAWDAHFVHGGLPRVMIPELRRAGLDVVRRDVIPMLNTEYHPNTYSYGMVQFITDFCAKDPNVGPDDAAAWRADLEVLAGQGEYFFSINRYQFVAIK